MTRRNRKVNEPPKVEAHPSDWWEQLRQEQATAQREAAAGPKHNGFDGTVERLRPAKRQGKGSR